MQLQSTLTCPKCSYRAVETMPTDACQFFYDCKGCGAMPADAEQLALLCAKGSLNAPRP